MDRIQTYSARALPGLLAVACALPLHAQSLDNLGTDFISAFMPNFDASVTLEVQLSSATETMVTVEYPFEAPTFSTTVAVLPGAVTVVEIPAGAATAWTVDGVSNNAVHAFGPDEFAMYIVNRRSQTSDAALSLPVDTFNTEFIVSAYDASFRSEFAVVAAFDNTTVTITPRVAMIGRPAGVPFSIVLNQGEGYLGQSSVTGAAGDLTGSTVTADRPVSLSNGNVCANVPFGVGFCDHVFEVAQPLQTWGTSIPATNLPLRPEGSIYKIIASEDDTTVMQNGAVIGTLNATEFIETDALQGNVLFSADKPIYVTQWMTGQDFPGNTTGDPAMGNMIPSAQYQRDYTFATPPGTQFVQNFVSIIASDADVTAGTILLDGAPVPASEFSPIPGTTLSAAAIEIASGTHTTASTTDTHGITVEGYTAFDSYIYPGGALFEFINPPENTPPVCLAETFEGPPPFATGSVSDSEADDSGVFFVTLLDGSDNLVLSVDPFTPGDPSASFRVDLIDPEQSGQGTVRGTDGAGNTCVADISLVLEDDSRCDVDGNGQVDILDIQLILAGRRMPADGPDDPRDGNGDGFITANDARVCVLECDFNQCATGGL